MTGVRPARTRLVITTSRRPTQRVREFCRDLREVIPGSTRMNRGKLSVDGLCAEAWGLGAGDVLVVEREKGGPGAVVLLKPDSEGRWRRVSILSLSRIRTRREYGSKGRGLRAEAIVTERSLTSHERGVVTEISDLLGLKVVESSTVPGCRCAIAASPVDGEVEFVVRVYPEGRDVGPSFAIGCTSQKESGE